MKLVETISGIRGIYGETLTDEVVNKYAKTFLDLKRKELGREPVLVIGMDTRPSSAQISEVFKGIFTNVIDVYYATTPMTELAVRIYGADGGVMITASHNPKEHNGMKFLDSTGGILQPEKAEELVKEKQFAKVIELSENKVEDKHEDIKKKYYLFLLEILGQEAADKIREANLTILLDSNGGTGIFNNNILEKFGVNVKSVNDKLSEFNREIEPTVHSLKPLQEMIKDEAFGAGFDCDADRVELVTKHHMVSGNDVLSLIIDSYLQEGEKVVCNDCTSKQVENIVESKKGEYIQAPVGEINVVNKMVSVGAKIGGEGSNGGGIILPARCRDGLMSILLILKLVAQKEKSVVEILAEYPKYYNKAIKVKNATFDVDKIKEYFSGEASEDNESLKIELEDAYIWFRMSKTEHGLLRVIADGKSEKKVDELLEEAKRILN